MGRHQDKDIKVILFRGIETQRDAASFNRNEAVEKMTAMSFDYIVLSVPHLKIVKNTGIFGKILQRLAVYFALFRIIPLTRNRCYHYVFFLRSVRPAVAFVSWCVCRLAGVKMAIERNEFPYVYIGKQNKIRKWFYEKFILRWHYRLFHVVFLMTDELIDFFSKYIRMKTIVQKLPMTVDFDRFNTIEEEVNNDPYFFYAGSLSEQKDGVESLICAFSEFLKHRQDVKLLIAGSYANGTDDKRLEELVQKYSLENNVEFLGSVSRDDIPRYIKNATALVLPRPDSLQARGGFPTKLGEYLASGRPVIVTRVGEIPEQLGEDEVFFISPTNLKVELTEKLRFIPDHPAQASETGLRGREAALRKFSIEANSRFIKNAFMACFNMQLEQA